MCQVKHDLMMLWVYLVRRRWKALEVEQKAIAKAARGLFPEKEVNIEEIWVGVPLGTSTPLRVMNLTNPRPAYSSVSSSVR